MLGFFAVPPTWGVGRRCQTREEEHSRKDREGKGTRKQSLAMAVARLGHGQSEQGKRSKPVANVMWLTRADGGAGKAAARWCDATITWWGAVGAGP